LAPLAPLFPETKTTHHVPFHFDVISLGTNIDVDTGFLGIEIWAIRQVGLFVLTFDGMVGETAIHIMAVDTNTHGENILGAFCHFNPAPEK
jgi:hypothetical protein